MEHNVQVLGDESLTRNERRKLKTKENVRKASVETFLELGYLKATVQDIMARADLGYGTFYKYYKSKQDVIVELATEALEMMTKDYKNSPVTERSLYNRTLYSVHNVVQTFAKHREVLLILRDCHTADEELRQLWVRISGEPIQRLKRDLTWSMKRGLCREVDLDTAVLALGGMIQSVGNYVIENNLSAHRILKISKDVARLFEKAIFIAGEIPAELLERRSKEIGANNILADN